MRLLLTTLAMLVLTGCSAVLESKTKMNQTQMQACVTKEVARYAALVEIAKAGDNSAKVAAIMIMQQQPKCQDSKSGE